MLNNEIRKFFSGFYSPILRYLDRISKIICDLDSNVTNLAKAVTIETRPLCVTPIGEGETPCFNIYGIYKVEESATTLIRYESQFGEVLPEDFLDSSVFTPCTCDCEGTGLPLLNGEGEGPLV